MGSNREHMHLGKKKKKRLKETDIRIGKKRRWSWRKGK